MCVGKFINFRRITKGKLAFSKKEVIGIVHAILQEDI